MKKELERGTESHWYLRITPKQPPIFLFEEKKPEKIDGTEIFGPFRSFSMARIAALNFFQTDINCYREILGTLRRTKKPRIA